MQGLGFLLLLASAAAIAAKHNDDKECMWHDYLRHDNITAWEFQGQPRRHKIRDRDKAIHKMESLLQQLTDDPTSGVQFVPESRWMAVFKETSFMVSTRHGHPIHRDPEHPKERPFPWKKLGYLRLRNYKLLMPAGAYIPSAMPGMADLAFKMKMVDPEVGPGEVQLPKLVGGAKLTAKIEEDMHCDHSRSSMSPLYRPVSQFLNVSRIANVKEYFPNLAQVARLDENEVLPFMHEVYRAKIVWTVVFNGVIGEANLVIKYNTSFEDAVAGNRPKNGEMTLRIRRDVAEATGTTGEEGRKRLWTALDKLSDAMQVFREHGWDDKTPSLPHKKNKQHKHSQPCHKHHHSHCYYEDPYYNEYEVYNAADDEDYDEYREVENEADDESEVRSELEGKGAPSAAGAAAAETSMPRPLLVTTAPPQGTASQPGSSNTADIADAPASMSSSESDTTVVSPAGIMQARASALRQAAQFMKTLTWLKGWWQQPSQLWYMWDSNTAAAAVAAEQK